MSKVVTCDVCGKPTDRIVAKLFKMTGADNTANKWQRSNYSAMADVGTCCAVRINQINWQPRKRRVKKKDEEVAA